MRLATDRFSSTSLVNIAKHMYHCTFQFCLPALATPQQRSHCSTSKLCYRGLSRSTGVLAGGTDVCAGNEGHADCICETPRRRCSSVPPWHLHVLATRRMSGRVPRHVSPTQTPKANLVCQDTRNWSEGSGLRRFCPSQLLWLPICRLPPARRSTKTSYPSDLSSSSP